MVPLGGLPLACWVPLGSGPGPQENFRAPEVAAAVYFPQRVDSVPSPEWV